MPAIDPRPKGRTVARPVPETDDNWRHLGYEVTELFSPGAPIDDLSLLAGRINQLEQMVDVVVQRGMHGILYGERGVGKSSLANTFSVRLITPTKTRSAISVTCDPSDDFSKIWRKVFRRLSFSSDAEGTTVDQSYKGEIYPDDVAVELAKFELNTIPIIILDEFDQIKDENAKTLMANAIKTLSDQSVRTTVIIVGVADSVGELLKEHSSIARCLRQIFMQRMSTSELGEIITTRLPKVGMSVRNDVLADIVTLSRGLPHYTHLFGQQAARRAIADHSLEIRAQHLWAAIPECINQTAQSLREQYHQATMSPRKGHIYREVLLAAALAEADDLGYFAPADLKKPLSALLRADAPVSLFGQHLKNLCQIDRGTILQQMGSPRKYRYRFEEPMMQSFIILQGLQNGLITRDMVKGLSAGPGRAAAPLAAAPDTPNTEKQPDLF
jgi:hypothetical protein